MELSALGPDFGVEVRGIGLIDVASSDSVYRATRAALEEHSVLLFRNQDVTDDVQAAFSRAFGLLERVKIGSVALALTTADSTILRRTAHWYQRLTSKH